MKQSGKALAELEWKDRLDFGAKAARLGDLARRGFQTCPGVAWPANHGLELALPTHLKYPLILRSSHRNEDSAEQSHAGEFLSILNVANASELTTAIASLRGSALATEPIFLQEQLSPLHSGVYFSTSPHHAELAELVVAQGHNFAVTSGQGVFESFFLNKNGRMVPNLSSHSASVGFQTLIEQVSATGQQIASQLEFAIDMEWAISRSNQLFVLQVRPITHQFKANEKALVQQQEWARLSKSAKGEGSFWTDASIGDVLFNVAPLTMSLFSMASGPGLSISRAFTNLGFKYRAPLSPIFEYCYGRSYLNLSNYLKALTGFAPLKVKNGRMVLNALGIGRHFGKAAMFALRLPHIYRCFMHRRDEVLSDFRNLPALQLSFESFAKLKQAYEGEYQQCAAIHLETDALTAFALARCRFWLKLIAGSKAKELENNLFTGLAGNFNTESNYALLKVARDELSWEAFSERFGHRGTPDWDLAAPRWREKPDMLLGMLQNLQLQSEFPDSEQDASQPHNIEARQIRIRTETENSLALKLRKFPLRLFAKRISADLEFYKRLSPFREETQSLCFRWVEIFRRHFIQFASTWGIDGDLVFYLEWPELEALAASPDRATDFKTCARERRHKLKILRSFRVPHLFYDSNLNVAASNLAPTAESDQHDFSGSVASPGHATGPVLVVEELSRLSRLSGNEILVLKYCDPSLTPFLFLASGLILEQGNSLSHGAIVAREMGIPCIYNVPGACQSFKTGEWVEMNANLGTIRRLQSK